MRLRLCLFIVLLISLSSPGDSNAQNTTPRIVDTLTHYRLGNDQGDPAFLDELAAKLDSVERDGNCISTTPQGSRYSRELSSTDILTG